MKKIYVWAGTGIFMLAIGLTGISCSREQGKEQIKGNARDKAMLPELQEKAPEKELPSTGHGKAAEGPEKTSMVVAKVNGIAITMNELLGEMNLIAPQFIKNARERTPEIDNKVKEFAFDILIFRELAAQEATKQGIKIGPDAVAEGRNQFRTKLGSDEKYRKYLEKMGLTEESLNAKIEKNKLFEAIVAKEVFQKAKANDKAAIEKRKEQWERDLKKEAKIEILLPKVEKQIIEDAHKGK